MKPNDIIIGRHYINANPRHNGVVYLGIGSLNLPSKLKKITRKELVIISGNSLYGGRVVGYRENPTFWKEFQLVPNI